MELLRPRFYNRITWLVVLGGLAIMSTPLWELLARALLKRALSLSLSGSNDAAWGFALCVLGLLYHMANTGFYEWVKANAGSERRQLEIEHDRALFNQADAIISQEDLESFIDRLDADHSFYMNDSARLDRLARFLSSTSNHFLTPSVAEATNAILMAWYELGQFLSTKFFIFPQKQVTAPYRLCMVPTLNMDREGSGAPQEVAKYDELAEHLELLTRKLRSHYREFRSIVKSELVI